MSQGYRRLLRETARLIALRDDPDRVYRLLRKRIPRLLPGFRFEVILLDPDDGTISFPVVSHLGSIEESDGVRIRPPAGEAPAWLAAQQPSVLGPEELGDARRAGRLLELGIRDVLVLPLVHRKEKLGALCIGTADRVSLDRPLRAFASDLASLLAAVLGRERTEKELDESRTRLEEKARDVRLLYEIATAVNSSLIIDRIFKTIVRETRRLIDFDRANLSVLEGEGRRLRLLAVQAGKGLRLERAAREDVKGSISGYVMASRKPFIVADLSQAKKRTVMEERLYRHGLLSYVALPLTVRGKVVGSFNLGSRRAGNFSESQLGLLRHVAEHLAVAVDNAQLLREARGRMRAMTALYEVAKTLLSMLDLDELLREVLRVVHTTFDFENCAVLLPNEKGDALYMRAAKGYTEERIRSFRVRIGEEGLTGLAASSGKTIYSPDVRSDPRYVRGIERGRSELAIPLTVAGEVIGVLDIESPEVDAFSPRDIESLELFAAQVALAVERARLFQRLQDQAMTDGLTGLLNQRYFHHRLQREVQRSARTGMPFSLALIDMDGLKEINDRCGHLAGNLAITEVAEILRRECREVDSVARYGGDEFAVILPETGLDAAMLVAEKLRNRIAETRVEGVGNVSASIGVACHPVSTENETMLVVLADRAMYEAKRLGKNRVAAAFTPKD